MSNDKKIAILKITIAVLCCGAVISLVGVALTLLQYSKGKKEYADLQDYVEVAADDTITDEIDEPIEEEIIDTPRLINVDFDMDYASLKAINSDLVGWIYYEGVDLSYPVVMDKGNDYYENYTFENEKNNSGAIFMDYLCKIDFNSFNTIIYGHNMRNGTMFGSLNNIIDDPDIIANYPYFYIFTEDEAMMYKIVSGYYTTNNSNTYNITLDYTVYDMRDYVDYMNKVSTYRDEDFFNKEVSEDMKICTLSTCHGLHSNVRTVIHGELVAREPRL